MTLEYGENKLRKKGKGPLADILRGVRETLGEDIPLPGEQALGTSGLVENLIAQERDAWKAFFGKEIKIPNPPKDLLEALKKIEQKDLGLEALYLPGFTFKEDSRVRGWRVKPEKWYWKQIRAGKIDRSAPQLRSAWVLIGNQRSGFNKSWDEIHQSDLPALAGRLGVDSSQVRLPRKIEFNVIGNLCHPEWGQDPYWEWLEDQFADGYRLIGGNSGFGGLANVFWYLPGLRVGVTGFRPLVEFPL